MGLHDKMFDERSRQRGREPFVRTVQADDPVEDDWDHPSSRHGGKDERRIISDTQQRVGFTLSSSNSL
ncbi:MAG: hypothetical protein WCX61_02520 [Candidatus Peribacteraceae bacterium]|jgi:hypothetical protein